VRPAQYAIYRGVGSRCVYAGIASGEIAASKPDGRHWVIDVGESDRRWHPQIRSTSIPALGPIPAMSPPPSGPEATTPTTDVEAAWVDITEERAQHERAKRMLAETKLAKIRGELIERAAAARAFASVAAETRERVMAVALALAGELAALDDPVRCEDVLRDALRAALTATVRPAPKPVGGA